MTSLSKSSASMLWILLLTAASTGTTLVLACATPFAALAALAAAHLSKRDGLILMLLAWGISQAVGFGLLHYPHTPKTFVWGIALGSAAIGGALGAYAVLDRVAEVAAPLRMVAAYIAAFVAFKAVVALWALGLGGIAITLDPALMGKQFVRDGAILVGLLALYHALIAIGLPEPQRRLAAA